MGFYQPTAMGGYRCDIEAPSRQPPYLVIDRDRHIHVHPGRPASPLRHFNSSPEVNRLVTPMYICFRVRFRLISPFMSLNVA